ncbi:MAG: S41 family peptidase, partial [Nannocystaceae bacterium]
DGDLLVKIDGQSTVNMRTVDAQQLLRGPVGVDVKVRVIRDGAYLNLTITRGKIRLPTSRHVLLPGDVGYIGLLSFQADTTERMVAAIKALQAASAEREGLKGLLLDLRGNSGGLLSQATAVVDQFVDVGDLVLVHSSESTEVERATRSMAVPQDLPLVVLIDEQSASASEIVSGSLKHLGRAAVIGRTSFGKGTVQMLREATPYGAALALKMTIAEYRVAGDRKINAVGVRPQMTLLPVQLSELPGVVRYYDRERFVRWRQRYQTSFLPSAVHDEGADAFALPEGPILHYLDDAGNVESDASMSEEVKDYMVDAELRIARALVEALAPHTGAEARKAALDSFIPKAREAQRVRVEEGLAAQDVDWTRAPPAIEAPALELRAFASRDWALATSIAALAAVAACAAVSTLAVVATANWYLFAREGAYAEKAHPVASDDPSDDASAFARRKRRLDRSPTGTTTTGERRRSPGGFHRASSPGSKNHPVFRASKAKGAFPRWVPRWVVALDASTRRALAASLHSLVAVGLIVALVAVACLVAAFFAVNIARESSGAAAA